MKKIKVLSWDRTSMSSRTISRFQPGKNRVRPESTTFKPKVGQLLINWGFRGSFGFSIPEGVDILNRPENVANASDKRRCLRILTDNEVPTLDFALNRTDAAALFENTDKVYCRTRISSHSGRGIIIANNIEELVDAQLYTANFPNTTEFRVHIFKGQITDITQKKSMSSERRERLGITRTERREEVRNLGSGWSFVRTEMDLYDSEGDVRNEIHDVSLDAMSALGLDFGAVDLLMNDEGECRVVEANTACGMKINTTTHYRYIKNFMDYANNDFSLSLYNSRYEGNFNNEHEGNIDQFIADCSEE